MIKWFCDVCKREIVAPKNPISIKAYHCSKARTDTEIGWGESYDIGEAFCHEDCADMLESEIKAAFERCRVKSDG